LVGSSVRKHASACENVGAAFSYMASDKLSKPAKTFFPDGLPDAFSIMGLVKLDTSGRSQTLLDVRDASKREVMSLTLDSQLVFKLSETPEFVNIIRLNHTMTGDG
uniref:VPS13_mid_rpt domain-containing protein n=1 Tax=Hydatigena taeniaeformis TaxID=6205 RepID=A0A0R3WUD2_HYDTA